MRTQLAHSILELVDGDITGQRTDAIVNAANSTLLGGGGVDGAIHRAGGPAILAECQALGGCATGDAKITTGGRLHARHVIHAVGPKYWAEGPERSANLLASAYVRSLDVAAENGLQSVAFPSISTGAFGYLIEAAAHVALTAVMDYLEGRPEASVRLVRFVLFGAEALRTYERVLAEVLARTRPAGHWEGDECP